MTLVHGFARFAIANLPPIESRVILNKENNVYYPGEEITGVLLVSHRRNIVSLGVVVTLEGHCIIKFTRGGKQYSETQEFLKEFCYVFGKPTTSKVPKKSLLKSGVHNLPFSIKIPEEAIPCSYKDSFGEIKYNIVASIANQNIFTEISSKKIKLKLNKSLQDSVLGAPTPINLIKSETSLFNRNTGLKFIFKLSKNIFSPKESIPYRLEIKNPEAESHVKFELLQKFTYKAQGELKKTFRVLFSDEKRIDTPVTSDSISLQFNNPQNSVEYIPSYFGHKPLGKNIDLQYFIKVEVFNNGKVLKGEIPIKIDALKEEEETGGRDRHHRIFRPILPNISPPNANEHLSPTVNRSLKDSIPAYSDLDLSSIGESNLPSYEDTLRPHSGSNSPLASRRRSAIFLF